MLSSFILVVLVCCASAVVYPNAKSIGKIKSTFTKKTHVLKQARFYTAIIKQEKNHIKSWFAADCFEPPVDVEWGQLAYRYNPSTRNCEEGLFQENHVYRNKFSLEECERICPVAEKRFPFICYQPRDDGGCRMFGGTKWYYNAKLGKCQKFTYGGCGGNDNKFGSLEECQAACPPRADPDRIVFPN